MRRQTAARIQHVSIGYAVFLESLTPACRHTQRLIVQLCHGHKPFVFKYIRTRLFPAGMLDGHFPKALSRRRADRTNRAGAAVN